MGRIGFVGLGVMGGPMAGHLVRAGLEVTVWNRTVSKSEPLKQLGAEVASSLADLARACQTILICVNRSEDVQSVLEEMVPHSQPGTLFIDHSTISPPFAGQLHGWLNEEGMRFVDAPITGGSMGAQSGQLTIFLGGSESDCAEAIKVIASYSKRVERVGGPGSGQTMKMANQIAVGGALLALCEALAFADKAGLDLVQTHDMVGGGAAGSWAFQNYGPKILKEDWSPGFSVKNQRKDFGYCVESASSLNAAIPGTLLVDNLLAKLEEEGHGEWTTAALFEVLRNMDFRP